MTIDSKLERKRDNGSLTMQSSSGPHYDRVEAWVVMASVDPARIAEARPLTTGSRATVSIRGVVGDGWSELTFGIEVVEAGALDYEIFTDLSTLVYRGGEVATLARGYWYERMLRVFDEQERSLEYYWPSEIFLAPSRRGEHACGVHGIIGSAPGRYALPTIGKAKAAEAEFIDPTFQVKWNPIAPAPSDAERGIPYEAEVVAADAKGQRIPLPSRLKLALAVETPAACELVSGYVVHRSPQKECRVVVTVPREPALTLTSRLP